MLPGRDDIVVDLDEVPHEWRGSPVSQIMHQRAQPPASGIGETQFLPNNEGLATNVGICARLMLRPEDASLRHRGTGSQ